MPPVFNEDECILCGACVDDCPGNILTMSDDAVAVDYPDECWHCGNCRISCPVDCVSFEFPLSMLV